MKAIIEKQNELLEHYRKFADDSFNYDELESWYAKRNEVESQLSALSEDEQKEPVKSAEEKMNEFVEEFKTKFSGSVDYMSGVNDGAYSMYRKLKML
jgi:transcription initiation factor IIF auxiliary subunit